MARLPTPGGDNGTWGDILNSFLAVAHASDGTLKQSSDISEAKAKADTAVQQVNGKPADSQGAVTLSPTDLNAEPAGLSATTNDTLSTTYVQPLGKSVTTEVAKLPWVHIKDFGAACNGTTIDTAAFNAAIAFVHGLGGGRVVVDGTILVDAEIQVPERVWIESATPGGWENYGTNIAGATIKLKSSSGLSASDAVIRFVYTGAITTERRHHGGMIGVTVNGNRTTNTANSGIILAGVRFVYLERVSVVRCGLRGFATATATTSCSEMYFDRCFAGWNGGSGFYLFGGDSTIVGAMAGVNDLDGFYLGLAATVCADLSSWNNHRDGLTIAATAATEFLQIDGGEFYDNDRAGITIESGIGVGNSVVGASCHGNGRDVVTYASATDRVGVRVLGAQTPSTLALHGISTGNRSTDTYQQYGVALQTASCNPTASGISGTNAVLLWYLVDATAIPEVQSGRFVPIKDNVFALGRSALRWLNVIALRHEVYANANDSQPRVRVGSTGAAAAIDFGAGGSTPTDVGIVRGSVGVLELTDGTTGGGGGAIRLGNNAGRACRLWSGSGAPTTPGPAGISYTLGDAYFRTDTPTTANQRLYLVTTAGTSPTWTGIL